MRVFVFGVLLAHTLNAQVSDSEGSGPATAIGDPAPLVTPGPNALAESDLLGTSADTTTGDAGLDAIDDTPATDEGDVSLVLPTGTADVIVNITSTEPPSVETTDDLFGSEETTGPGVDFPTSTNTDNIQEETTAVDDPLPAETGSASLVGSDLANDSTVLDDFSEPPTASEELGLGSNVSATLDAGADTEATGEPTDTPVDDFITDPSVASPVGDLGDANVTSDLFDDIPTEAAVAEPDFGAETTSFGDDVADFAAATAVPDPDAIELGDSGDEADVTDADTETAAAPEFTDPASLENPGTVEEPLEPEITESSSTVDLEPTPFSKPLAGPGVALPEGGALSGGVGAAYADDSGAGTWTGEDAGNYDGQDIGDEDCPAYCYEEDYDTDDAASTHSADEDDEDADHEDDKEEDTNDSLVTKVVRWITRRALGSSNGGFAAFSWPMDGKDEIASYDSEAEDCDEDIPDWAYESVDKEPEACPAPKPKCPAKCYEHGNGPKPYPVSSIVPSGYEPYPVSSVPSGYEPYTTPGASTTVDGYSAILESSSAAREYTPHPVPDESTTDYQESTATSTRTTFVTSTTTVPGGYQDSGAQADYTGDALANICPKTCDPFNPAANKCDITSSCTTTGKGKYYCACRAGFRASAWNAKDFSKQFKFPDQPYVYTAEGVVCDKVCSDQTCTEVLSRPQCQ